MMLVASCVVLGFGCWLLAVGVGVGVGGWMLNVEWSAKCCEYWYECWVLSVVDWIVLFLAGFSHH